MSKNFFQPPKFGEYKELNTDSPTGRNVNSSDFQQQLFGTPSKETDVEAQNLKPSQTEGNNNLVQFTQVVQDSYVPSIQPEKPVDVQLEFNESNLNQQGATGSMKSKDVKIDIKDTTQPGGGPPQPSGWSRYLSLGFLRPYFDVDTMEVLQRIFYGNITFFQPVLSQTTLERPDLYGPFWIATTLVFFTAAIGNFIDYAKSTKATVTWSSDPGKVVAAAIIFYGYQVISALAIYFALRYKQAPGNSLIQTICIYGYVLAIYIPISFLCIIPNSIVQWVFVLLGTVTSALSLVVNFGGIIRENYNGFQAMIFLGSIAVFHLILGIVLKIVIFKVQSYNS